MTCFTISLKSFSSILWMTVLYPLHFSACPSRCFAQKFFPHWVHSCVQLQAQVLHFACSVLSTAGIVVMALLVREIINQLERVLPQKCGGHFRHKLDLAMPKKLVF